MPWAMIAPEPPSTGAKTSVPPLDQLSVERSQLWLAVALEHETVTLTPPGTGLVALEVAAHEVDVAGAKVQVDDSFALGVHLGVTTERVLLERDRLVAGIREIDVRHQVRHGMISSVIAHPREVQWGSPSPSEPTPHPPSPSALFPNAGGHL
jgi:hypothetical protein